MNRKPLAMKRLVLEVQHNTENVEVDYHEPDGFGIYRVVRFDAESSRLIAPAMETIAAVDKRIVQVTWVDGELAVEFVTTVLAEDMTPYSFGRVSKTLGPAEEGEDEPGELELRLADLQALSRAELDEMYPEYAEAKNKGDLIAAVLADEGL